MKRPAVIPAQAGNQGFQQNARRGLSPDALDPRLRGDDGAGWEPGE
jgi:hypothetical protein